MEVDWRGSCPAPDNQSHRKELPARARSKSAFTHIINHQSSVHSTNRQVLWRLTSGQPAAGRQSQIQQGEGGPASVVIEILPEQNLVCVIIVRRARNEAKIHSTWCIHCFQPNTHQAPQQPWLLYNGPHQKQLRASCSLNQGPWQIYSMGHILSGILWDCCDWAREATFLLSGLSS